MEVQLAERSSDLNPWSSRIHAFSNELVPADQTQSGALHLSAPGSPFVVTEVDIVEVAEHGEVETNKIESLRHCGVVRVMSGVDDRGAFVVVHGSRRYARARVECVGEPPV